VLKLKSAEQAEAVSIVVLQAEDRQFGLVVDGINDTAGDRGQAARQAVERAHRVMPAPPSWATAEWPLSSTCSGASDSDLLQVIVYSSNGRSVGLVVDEILDIADQSAAVQQIRQVATLKGAAVIQQRVTDLLDVAALLAAQQLAGGEGAQL
jgi:chemotaxis signal transduction protein